MHFSCFSRFEFSIKKIKKKFEEDFLFNIKYRKNEVNCYERKKVNVKVVRFGLINWFNDAIEYELSSMDHITRT